MAKRKMTSIYLPPELQERIDALHAELSVCKSTFITKCITEYFDRVDAQKAAYRDSQAARNALIEASYNVG